MYHFAPAGSRGEYPFVVPGDSLVHGEVLAFTDWPQALAILDRIEGHPVFYTRQVVRVRYAAGGEAEAQCYFIRPEAEQRGLEIESGDWLLESEIEETE
jgi:gamma-glutamylcyclotransferase (GGCT)/AIG2-like uncharacterized protein YtfP